MSKYLLCQDAEDIETWTSVFTDEWLNNFATFLHYGENVKGQHRYVRGFLELQNDIPMEDENLIIRSLHESFSCVKIRPLVKFSREMAMSFCNENYWEGGARCSWTKNRDALPSTPRNQTTNTNSNFCWAPKKGKRPETSWQPVTTEFEALRF